MRSGPSPNIQRPSGGSGRAKRGGAWLLAFSAALLPSVALADDAGDDTATTASGPGAQSAPDPAPVIPAPQLIQRYRGLGPATGDPNHLRAALEMLGVLAIGTAQYWAAAESNSRDWDFPSFSERFSWKGIRFDNNTHVTNNMLHPLAGAAYYGLSRANGLSVGESIFYAQLSSAVWEWGLEWREKVSINDMITTTAAGTAAGEFLVQLAAYLSSAPGETNWAQDVARVTLGAPVSLHDYIDGRRPHPAPAPDRLGFSSGYKHRFTLDLQQAWADDAGERRQSMTGVALEAYLSSLPGFLSDRDFSLAFAEGNFSSAKLDLQFGDGDLREAEVHFDAVLAGYYTQVARPSLRGLLLGISTGMEFLERNTLGRKDQAALAHLVGPTVAALWSRSGLTLVLTAFGHGDFAAIRSLAWRSLREIEPGTYKSSLEAGDYQYHLGLSARLQAELRFHSLVVSAEQTYGAYGSIEGQDRSQEEITRDTEGTEILDERRIRFALEPPDTWLRFHVGVERLSHESRLGGVSAGRLERRLSAGFGLVF